jgi:iron complex transport system substrate-binding protein
MARFLPSLIALVTAVAAVQGAGRPPANVTVGCINNYDASADYFPDKARVIDSRNFSVEYRRSYKVVSVRAASPTAAERYVLLQCGAPRSAIAPELRGIPVIDVPITSLFAYSTTHLPLLVDLDRVDVVTGVAQIGDVTNAPVLERIKQGKIVEFASNQLDIDAERVVAARPSLLMVTSGATPALPAIRSAGIGAVVNTEWLEPTPLGRAEWLKFMALFLNEERKGESVYAAMKGRYAGLTSRTTALPSARQPLVMTGRSERGVFTVSGGRGYVAALIRDAGGRYVWADNTSTTLITMDLEAQLRRAANADYWINGNGWRDLRSMLTEEPRYAEFKPYRLGQIWVYDLRASGAKDYWSRSVTRPDILLADLVKIFHPSLVPEHAFEWYMQLPGSR